MDVHLMNNKSKKYSRLDLVIEAFRLSKSKRSQVTFFIIIALIIIVVIAIFFSIKHPVTIQTPDLSNPQAFIESCTREATQEAVDRINRNGGDIEPKGYVRYGGEEIVYLCFNGVYYRYCVNQRPLLVEHIENEITNFITPRIKECFSTLESRYKRTYDLETGEMTLGTRLYPDQVIVKINKKFKISKGDNVREFDVFKMTMISPVFNFAEIAMEIVNQEAIYCHFDDVCYMFLHPRFDISSALTGNSDHIYFIKERTTDQEFRFATRSCLLPPGF